MRNETEYMYASARIRAAEGKETAKIRLDRMLDCRSPEQLFRTVLEMGFLSGEQKQPSTLTEALELAWEEAVALVKDNVPEPSVYDFLLYKYDCNNIKTALKADILGLDYSGLFYTCGTFDPKDLSRRLAAGDTAGMPVCMAGAVENARGAYARTGEGRAIDFCLDSACYADMAEKAAETEVPLFREYVSAKADITNILSSVRLADRSAKESAAAVFAQAYVPGGTLPAALFTEDGCLGYEALRGKMEPGMLKDTVDRIIAQGENARPEKEFDNAVYRLMNRDRYVPFGIHVPAVFLVNREAELKNCRIIAAGLEAGASPAQLRERIRVEYV